MASSYWDIYRTVKHSYPDATISETRLLSRYEHLSRKEHLSKKTRTALRIMKSMAQEIVDKYTDKTTFEVQPTEVRVEEVKEPQLQNFSVIVPRRIRGGKLLLPHYTISTFLSLFPFLNGHCF